MKLEVDARKCAGHALCTVIDPDRFEMNDAGKADVIGTLTADDLDLAREVVAECPAAAVLLHEGE
ncbi:ferredoxin [Rhodococcus artemisiae]|uniref:Ferredoxin n=1 Tax=Rhodococcus artemisiae TaxID=714159 RepID=A0ABU7LFU0_9NOCA|nr:ferredoxin [Rhodococcus artemisiae]MEE2060416.1 ferredoxin [Rhodococcus artemisiae]